MFSSRRTLLRVLEREREAFAAERARLIDQICALSGRPWTLPPAALLPRPLPVSLVDELYANPDDIDDID